MGLWVSLKHELFGQVNFGGDVTRENRVAPRSVNKQSFLSEHSAYFTGTSWFIFYLNQILFYKHQWGKVMFI